MATSKSSVGKSRENASRILAKLKFSVENGNYYEAHQIYRTLFYRYKSQGKYSECSSQMLQGATTLLKHGQNESGADLSLLYLEALEAVLSSQIEMNETQIDEMTSLHALVSPDCPERLQFSTRSLKLVRTAGSSEQLSQLHRNFALTLWKEKNYSGARYHFIHSSDGEKCANMLIEYSVSHGYKGEVDLFIAQAVFQYLCLRNKSTALVAFYTYTGKHPKITPGPPFLMPLLNFLWFLLLAVEGGSLPVFTVLCEKYEISLSRDPTYREYLDRIGQLFFGLPPPQKPLSMFENVIQNMMGGLLSGDAEEAASSPPRPSRDTPPRPSRDPPPRASRASTALPIAEDID